MIRFLIAKQIGPDAYMRRHGIPEADREFYSLSSVDLRGVVICELTEEMTILNVSLSM